MAIRAKSMNENASVWLHKKNILEIICACMHSVALIVHTNISDSKLGRFSNAAKCYLLIFSIVLSLFLKFVLIDVTIRSPLAFPEFNM